MPPLFGFHLQCALKEPAHGKVGRFFQDRIQYLLRIGVSACLNQGSSVHQCKIARGVLLHGFAHKRLCAASGVGGCIATGLHQIQRDQAGQFLIGQHAQFFAGDFGCQ